jgi:hypothetical protein
MDSIVLAESIAVASDHATRQREEIIARLDQIQRDLSRLHCLRHAALDPSTSHALAIITDRLEQKRVGRPPKLLKFLKSTLTLTALLSSLAP